jgi:allophanate hydrolase subunit 1
MGEAMTKVEVSFELERPLDAAATDRIVEARSVYGMLRVAPGPGPDKLTVEYDASRLTAADVEAILRRAGVPVRPNEASQHA